MEEGPASEGRAPRPGRRGKDVGAPLAAEGRQGGGGGGGVDGSRGRRRQNQALRPPANDGAPDERGRGRGPQTVHLRRARKEDVQRFVDGQGGIVGGSRLRRGLDRRDAAASGRAGARQSSASDRGGGDSNLVAGHEAGHQRVALGRGGVNAARRQDGGREWGDEGSPHLRRGVLRRGSGGREGRLCEIRPSQNDLRQ